MGKKTPYIAPFPWDCATPPEEDRATAVGNMHTKFGKDLACGSGDMLADRHRHTDRQTNRHTHTQTRSLQYSATASAGEVNIGKLVRHVPEKLIPIIQTNQISTSCLRQFVS